MRRGVSNTVSGDNFTTINRNFPCSNKNTINFVKVQTILPACSAGDNLAVHMKHMYSKSYNSYT